MQDNASERRLGRQRVVLLLAFLAGGAALRFAALARFPPANYRDVALTALDAMRAAAGHPRLHFTYDEGMYADLMGLAFALFGVSDVVLRGLGAACGLLTCWGVARLGQALDRPRAGLLGAGLLAVSFWHVLLSRSGFRVILLPLLLVHATALLVVAMRRGGRLRFTAAGLLFGLGVHAYPAIRFAPLILPLYLLAERRDDRRRFGRSLPGLLVFAAAALVAALPMLLHYLHHPEHFNFPHRVVSVFSPRVDAAQIPAELAGNLLRTALMFHVRGDANWRHNLAGAPMLDPVSGILLIAGAVILLRRGQGAARALLFGWLSAMLLPNLLSVEGVPHGLRSCAVLPGLALICGIGLEHLERCVAGRAGRRLAAAGSVALLVLLGCFTAYRYFVVWGTDARVVEAHDGALRAAARVLLEAPPGTDRILVANGTGSPAYGYPAEAQVYLFEMRDAPPIMVGPKDAALLILQGRPALVALIRSDDRVERALRELNPQASIRRIERPDLSPESPVYRID